MVREAQSLACVIQNMWLKATALNSGLQIISAVSDLEESAVLADLTGLSPGDYAFEACQIGGRQPKPAPRYALNQSAPCVGLPSQ